MDGDGTLLQKRIIWTFSPMDFFCGSPSGFGVVFSISHTDTLGYQHNLKPEVQRNQRRDFTPENGPQHSHTRSCDSEIDPLHPSSVHLKKDKRICLPCHFTTSSTTAALNQPAAAPIPTKNRQGEHNSMRTNTAIQQSLYSWCTSYTRESYQGDTLPWCWYGCPRPDPLLNATTTTTLAQQQQTRGPDRHCE